MMFGLDVAICLAAGSSLIGAHEWRNWIERFSASFKDLVDLANFSLETETMCSQEHKCIDRYCWRSSTFYVILLHPDSAIYFGYRCIVLMNRAIISPSRLSPVISSLIGSIGSLSAATSSSNTSMLFRRVHRWWGCACETFLAQPLPFLCLHSNVFLVNCVGFAYDWR